MPFLGIRTSKCRFVENALAKNRVSSFLDSVKSKVNELITVRVFIKYLITLGYLLRTKRLRAYSL